MSYFDNANNRVTRKSFGSKVDKEFKREGVIPVRDRSKKDPLAESAAKFEELNKKVNDRKLQDLKQQKALETKLREGYQALKDDLMKDFISEICVEALLVDEDVVVENLKNIVEMVERHVEDLGGFEGVKKIANSTNNPVLKNMVSVCEATAKKVGERNTKDCSNGKCDPNFGLNKIELEEYDYRKKEMGAETIVNNIKDKVFQVVQDEQKLSADKQMVMNDIQNKVSELEAPLEEAMKFIFERPGVEEDTLFNSIMRSHYKQLLESNSSAIFESFDYKELQDPLFENEEFEMNDANMDDIDDVDKREIEDMFINECRKIYDADDLEEALESFYKLVLEGSENIRSYAQSNHYKSLVRKVQGELEYVEEKMVKNIQRHSRKISDRKLDKSIVKWEQDIERVRNKIKNEKDKIKIQDYREDLNTLEAELKALKVEKSHRGRQLKIAKEANPYMKSTMESVDDVKARLNNMVTETDDMEVHGDEPAPNSKEMEKLKSPAKVKEEVILCPTCGKEECTCKVVKEADDIFESYMEKFDDICDKMNDKIVAHESARTNVIESLTKTINDELTIVPYLQTKDVNLNNLELVYKTKLVCESLKNNLNSVYSMQEAATLKRAVDLNIASITETLNVIKDREDMTYKAKILNAGRNYLYKINNAIDYNSQDYSDEVFESNSVFNTPEDVERIFEHAREYYVIESTDKDLMELVMAEAIVEYTILETFNTLHLINYTKDSVRQMSRKNISK